MLKTKEISLCPNRRFSKSACSGLKSHPVEHVLSFHQQLQEYEPTPLIELNALAQKLGIQQIWCKDESTRFGLKAYKALGGAYAIARFLQQKWGLAELSFAALHADNFPGAENKLVFATTTDGNHGLGVAYIAGKLGYKSQIYVPHNMVKSRIKAIEAVGGTVTIFRGSYDDAVRQIAMDAEKYNWQLIADTAWEGYTQIPEWIMEGYSTIFEETHHQLVGQTPTHIFIQAGVGSLAASLCRYFRTVYAGQEINIIITEPERADCFFRSAQINDGRSHAFEGEMDTMMAGLACAEPNPLAWEIIRDCANHMISCTDEMAALGMRVYYNPEKEDSRIVSGESGGVTMGALYKIMSDKDYAAIKEVLSLEATSKILLINTEGDTDPVNFQKVVKAKDSH